LLLTTALIPNGISLFSPRVSFLASIDHCVWFHEPFKFDEWILYEMESPISGYGRGYTAGRLFTEKGKLVLSCCQEGVVRIKPKL
jgi:acyl-CoA thioesterase-2